jgi:hypothetical protein
MPLLRDGRKKKLTGTKCCLVGCAMKDEEWCGAKKIKI